MQDKIKPIYSGNPEDFHWAGFGSGTGTNLRECARAIKPSFIFSNSARSIFQDLEEFKDVDKLLMSSYFYCGSFQKAIGDEKKLREYQKRSDDFDRRVVDELHRFEDRLGFGIDLIVLGGYMKLVGKPLLDAYRDRIINVHPADLSILDEDNMRIYVGDNAVYDAIRHKQQYTLSSVMIVDEGEDHGEILTQGPSIAVDRTFTIGLFADTTNQKLYAKKHQEKQKKRSDWPALTTALEMISEGRIALGTEKVFYDEWRAVYVDGKKMPYEGFQVEDWIGGSK